MCAMLNLTTISSGVFLLENKLIEVTVNFSDSLKLNQMLISVLSSLCDIFICFLIHLVDFLIGCFFCCFFKSF